MIRYPSSQLSNITRQCSALMLRRCLGPTSFQSSGNGCLSKLRNENIVPFQSVMSTKMANCRLLSSTTKEDGSNISETKKDGTPQDKNVNSLANEEWQKFQDSITFVEPARSMKDKVDGGFIGKRKVRGGRMVRKQQEKKLLREQALNPSSTPRKVMDVGGGRFPSLRYSDEETQRLLDEAHANIPKRTGKRGTRNLQRQSNRLKVIYADHARRKADRVGAHNRKMEKRSRIAGETREVRMEAEMVRGEETEYHMNVLKKWAEMHNLVSEGGDGKMVGGEKR